ncbi:MAG: tetratricopeptide repeat protein [Syntrophobacteria bacterium]
MTAVEDRIIEDIAAGKDISLERALLVVSGLQTEGEIAGYIRKLDQIHERFIHKLEKKVSTSLSTLREYMPGLRAKLLFEYLWNTKPRRCNSNFLLTHVVDAQLDPDVHCKVGMCIGLTSLYTVLGLRENLNLTIVSNDSHMLNRLRTAAKIYNIEHTDPLGFDSELADDSFHERPPISLVANVLNSRGLREERKENLAEALRNYNKAIALNPHYANAYNNCGNVKLKEKNYHGAIEDYDTAIELNVKFDLAYCNRAMARQKLGDYSGALRDYGRAIEIEPHYEEALYHRGLLREKMGDFTGAADDLARAAELNPEVKEKITKSYLPSSQHP